MQDQFDENGFIIEPEEMNQEYEPSYFMMITADILFDRRLNEFQKLMFAAITGLCKLKGYCWATNKYFEKLFNKGETQVSLAISKLEELGYITREIILKRKREKDGSITQTKTVAFRKLCIVLKPNQTRGSAENHTRGSVENQNQLDNNIIDNNSNFIINNKISATEEPLQIGKDDNLDIILDLGIPEDNKDILGKIDTIPLEPVVPQKRKQGVNIAPYIDACDKYFKLYQDIKKALTNYIIAVNSCRAIWTLDEWKQLLEDLVSKHSMKIPGTEGVKIMPIAILNEIEKSLRGNGKEPYMYFGDYKEMEPQFNLNQDFSNS